MEVKPITEIIGYRIVGTGIFCTYGVEDLNDSIIEVIQDYMKDNQANESIVEIYCNNSIYIHYCGECNLDYIDDFSLEQIKIFSSSEEFSRLNDIDDKIKSLDYTHRAYRKYIRKHNNGYVSKTIYWR